uniref:ATP synthase F0 subunit 8 n=1 Tax=Baizongia pistaciae TaxID=198322 RepID=A0A1Z1MWR4_BAIPI|nr:ATP synthase F0 subunit 8 [Baizongia pistaciae]ARW70347.1 ATP synthase F0 subunit 8 [Baizongia pistaciae]
MAPMNWLMMFLFFISMLFITLMMINFIFIKNNTKKSKKQLKLKNYNKFI